MKNEKKLKENKPKEKDKFNINEQDIMLEDVFSNDDLEKIIMNRDLLSIFFHTKTTKNSNENSELENIIKIQKEFEFIDTQSKYKLINFSYVKLDENQNKEIIMKINTNLSHIEIKEFNKDENFDISKIEFIYKNKEIQEDLLEEIKLLQFNRVYLVNHLMQKIMNFIQKSKLSPLANSMKWYFN